MCYYPAGSLSWKWECIREAEPAGPWMLGMGFGVDSRLSAGNRTVFNKASDMLDAVYRSTLMSR